MFGQENTLNKVESKMTNATTRTIKVRKELASDVVLNYGHRYNGQTRGKKSVYGFECGAPIDCDFWFDRKKDAEFSARWIEENQWDGVGDLKTIVGRLYYSQTGDEFGKSY